MTHAPSLVVVWLFLAAVSPLAAQPPKIEVEELTEPTPPAAPASEVEKLAEAAYSEGNLAKAIELYLQVGDNAELPRDRARVLVTAAWLETLEGKRSEASLHLERALFADPTYPLQAELYSPEFVAMFQDAQPRALAERSRQAADSVRRGAQLLSAGDRLGARGAFMAALSLQPNQPRALFNLALVDLADGAAEAALAGFEKVASLGASQPESVSRELRAQALASAGSIYLDRADLAAAEQALAQAVALTPGDAKAWNDLGIVRLRTGRKDEATTAFLRARSLAPEDVNVLTNLGKVHSDSGRWVDAVAAYVEATRRKGDDPRLWLALALSQRGLGNSAGAVDSLNRVLVLDVDNRGGLAVQAATFLAAIHLDGRAYDEAIENAKQALVWQEDAVDNWLRLGLATQAQGDLVTAAQHLERAVTLAPERADLAYSLGSVYLDQRDFVRAESLFRKALEVDPSYAPATEILAKLESMKAAATPGKGGRRGSPKPLGAQLAEANYPELGLRGLRVESIVARGVAAGAGLAIGDLILKVDGRVLSKAKELTDYLAGRPPGSEPSLDILRGGKPLRVSLKL